MYNEVFSGTPVEITQEQAQRIHINPAVYRGEAGKSPRVGENDNWEVFNNETGEWEDTGVYSKGDISSLIATKEKAGQVRPGEEFSVEGDGTLHLSEETVKLFTPEIPEYTIEEEAGSDECTAYKLTKNGEQTGVVINIPKDTAVESGSIVTNPEGEPEGVYLGLVMKNKEAPVYINVNKLAEQIEPKAGGYYQVDCSLSTSEAGYVGNMTKYTNVTITFSPIGIEGAEVVTSKFSVPHGKDGENGKDGSDGSDGGYYKPSVNSSGLLTWTKSKSSMPTVNSTYIKGPQGASGTSAKHSWNGTILTITSANGTSSADLKGAPGNDGVTPHIGDNGNWYIRDYDTGICSHGAEGHSPYAGENGNWWEWDNATGEYVDSGKTWRGNGEAGSADIASTDSLGVVRIGNNLDIDENGVLSVKTADAAEEDNTRPITSAAVYAAVGNIEALLKTI